MVQEKNTKNKEKNTRTLEQKYKHWYKTKHNRLQSYTYLNKHRGRKDFLCNSNAHLGSSNEWPLGRK